MSRFGVPMNFGNRSLPVIPQPMASPNLGASNDFSAAQQALGQAVGIGTAIAGNRAQQIQHAGRMSSAGASLRTQQVQHQSQLARYGVQRQLGEQEVKQADQRLQAEESHRELIRSQFDSEELKDKYDKLADMEMFGARAMMRDKTPEEAAAFLMQNPIADPKNAAAVARILATNLVNSHESAIYTTISERVSAGEDPKSIRPTDLMAAQMSKIDFSQLPPEVGLEYKGQILSRISGYLTGHISNTTARKQAEAQNHAESQLVQGAFQFLAGEPGADDDRLYQLATEKVALTPGQKATDETYRTESAFAVGKAVQHLIESGRDPNEIKANLAGLRPSVKKQLELNGTIDRLDNKIAANRESAIAQYVTNAGKLAEDLSDDIEGLTTLRGQAAATLQGDARKIVLADIDKKIRTVNTDTSDSRSILKVIGDKTIKPGNFNPTPKALNDAWNDQIRLNDPASVMTQFIDHGFSVPDAAVAKMKDDWVQNPPAAITMLQTIDAANPRMAPGIARQIDPDGLLWAASKLTAGLDPQSAEYQQTMGLVTQVLANPQARAMAHRADDALRNSNPQKALGSMDGITQLLHFEAAFTYRFLESFALGVGDEKQAMKRAERVAASDVKGKIASIPVRKRGGIFPRTNRVAFSSDLYGIGSMANPNHDLAESFRASVARFGAETGAIAIPEFGFKSAEGIAYVPASDGSNPVAFMEWNGHEAVKTIKAGDEGFDRLKRRFLKQTDPEDLSPMAPLRNRAEYGVSSLQEYDAKFHPTNANAGMRNRWMELLMGDWETQFGGPLDQSNPDEMQQFFTFSTRRLREQGWAGWSAAPVKSPGMESGGGE